MATSKKKKAPVATDVATDLAPPQYAERLERIESQLSMLVEALTSPIDPPSLVKKGLTSQKSRGAQALRARIGRAAKRNGMTSAEWIEKYGLVDVMPTPD